jgi:hypothetical protein
MTASNGEPCVDKMDPYTRHDELSSLTPNEQGNLVDAMEKLGAQFFEKVDTHGSNVLMYSIQAEDQGCE